MDIERGDILLIALDPTKGFEINKTRPAIVVSNNIANSFSPLITVVPITSQKLEKIRVFESLIAKATGLAKPSKAVVAQLRTVDKTRVQKKIGKVSRADMSKIDEVLKLHLALE